MGTSKIAWKPLFFFVHRISLEYSLYSIETSTIFRIIIKIILGKHGYSMEPLWQECVILIRIRLSLNQLFL